MKNLKVLVATAICLLTAQIWAANAAAGGMRATIKADEAAVHSDKEALDSAETAAGLTETFPPHNSEKKPGAQQGKTQTPEAPGQRITHMLEHVDKELAKVTALLGQSNLPSAVSSAAQKLSTDLNKLKTDLNSAETSVASKK